MLDLKKENPLFPDFYADPDIWYYIAYHRFARPSAQYEGINGFRREVCLDLLEFDENGKIKTVEKH